MRSPSTTVAAYLASLPEDRRQAISAVRDEINRRLPAGYQEGIQYGMIGWSVPHSIFPSGYHCDPKQPLPFASLASQKNYMSLYLFCIYCDEGQVTRFQREWKKTGKKLDMGKSCVRFKKLDDLPLQLVGETVARMPVQEFIAAYQKAFGSERRTRPQRSKKKTGTKTAVKRSAARKTTAGRAPGAKKAAARKPKAAAASRRAPSTKAPARKK